MSSRTLKTQKKVTGAANSSIGTKRYLSLPLEIASVFILIFLILIPFIGVMRCGFIYLDTESYVTSNPMIQNGFSWASIKWAFTSIETSDWQPLIWISYMADHYFSGLNAAAFHLINLIWHILNVLLVYWVFRKMTGDFWRSLLLALFFGVHPLRVESVAWIAERKDVLSGFFWWLTVGAYALWTKKALKKHYAAAVFFYLLAVLSKPVVVTLPLVLLMLDFWPLNRLHSRKQLISRITEKAPFFLLSLLSVVMTLWAAAGTMQFVSLEKVSLFVRIGNGLISYWAYIGKTLWPFNLSIFYPFPHSLSYSVIAVLIALTALAAFTLFAWQGRRQRPYFLTGWLWYLIMLFPMIGLLRVSHQAMADRYMYLPGIGLGVLVFWGAKDIFKKFKPQIAALGALSFYVFFAGLTWKQVSYWESPFTLNEHADAAVADNYMAWSNLGYAYFKNNQPDRALEYLNRLKPQHSAYYIAAVTKARILLDRKQYREGSELLEFVTKKYPDGAAAHYLLGVFYAMQRKADEAAAKFSKAIGYKKTHFVAQKALARLAIDGNELIKAESLLRDTLASYPHDGAANLLMGNLERKRGSLDEAVEFYKKAASGNPRSKRALSKLILIWLSRGEIDAALEFLKKILKDYPQDEQIKIHLANALIAGGDRSQALALVKDVLRTNPSSAAAKQTLADLETVREPDSSGANEIKKPLLAGINISNPQELNDLINILNSQEEKK